MKELPYRKQPRLKICTQNRIPFFGGVGADSISARMIDRIFNETMKLYDNIYAYEYVIMPNHVHAIIILEYRTENQQHTISEIVQTFKRHSTVEYINLVKQGIVQPFDKKLWQRSFHDHIIRNEKGYKTISDYIKNNPFMWEQDVFHVDT